MIDARYTDHASSDYCYRCDFDTHYCMGCGGDIKHGETCADCQAEIDAGLR